MKNSLFIVPLIIFFSLPSFAKNGIWYCTGQLLSDDSNPIKGKIHTYAKQYMAYTIQMNEPLIVISRIGDPSSGTPLYENKINKNLFEFRDKKATLIKEKDNSDSFWYQDLYNGDSLLLSPCKRIN